MSYLNELGIVCALGADKGSVLNALINEPKQEYLTEWQQAIDSDKLFWCGQAKIAEEELPNLDKFAKKYQSKNNSLAYIVWRQIQPQFELLTKQVAPSRIAVVIGTSTSGIREGECARREYRHKGDWPENYHYGVQDMASPADFIATIAGAKGPVYSISTACSSSAKALASAKALLANNLVDVVICGGVDTLSQLPNNGFNSLESVAEKFCNPLSAERDGINIGEGAALFLMSNKKSDIKLFGVGESSDAHHISAPHPEGEGAHASMNIALKQARLSPEDIDYINLHGTGTPKNDDMEAKAVYQLFHDKVPCSSTKRFTGHTLGAAGAMEAGILWLLLSKLNKTNTIPMNKSDFGIDPKLAKIALANGQKLEHLDFALSNSFAFGGNNISLILGKEQ